MLSPNRAFVAASTVIAALLAGCSSAPPATVSAKQGPPELVVSRATCEPVANPTLAKASWDARARALHDLVSGRASLAVEGLARILAERPGDIGAYALRAAAQGVLAREAERGNTERARVKPIQIPGDVGGKPHAFGARPAPKVEVLAIDSSPGDWFAEHGLSEPYQLDEVAGGAMPIGDASISRQVRFDDHGVLVFGNSLVVVSPASGSPARAFDLHNLAAQGSSVIYAQVVDRLLVVLFSEEAGSRLLGVDMDQKRAIWSTERGALSSDSFAVSGARAFVGASDAERGDAIVTVDLASGSIEDRVPLTLNPRWIYAKDGAILVLDAGQSAAATLGVDGVALPAAVAAGLASEAPPAESDVAVLECQYGRALDAIDARDVDRAMAEASGFVSPDDAAARALVGAAEFIRHAKVSPNTTTDLAAAPTIALARPGGSAFSKAPRKELAKAPVIQSTKAPPPTSKKPPKPGPKKPPPPPRVQPVDLEEPMLSEPYSQPPSMESPPQPPFSMPNEYGTRGLTRAASFLRPVGSKPAAWNVGLYGSEYLAVLSDQRAVHMFDLRALHDGSAEPIDFAIVGDTLILSVGRQGPNSDTDGYVAGYALDTGALLWRSESDAVSTAFVVVGDHVVVGRGKADPPSRLIVLRSDTGETVSTVPTDCAIQSIGWSGPELLATCNQGWELFKVER